jgi:hypothetical protein
MIKATKRVTASLISLLFSLGAPTVTQEESAGSWELRSWDRTPGASVMAGASHVSPGPHL